MSQTREKIAELVKSGYNQVKGYRHEVITSENFPGYSFHKIQFLEKDHVHCPDTARMVAEGGPCQKGVY